MVNETTGTPFKATETTTTAPAAPAAMTTEPARGEMCIIDLGEHSRRRVKRLRKGRGRLMDKVERTLANLEEDGVISASAQTVIVIVREEPTGFSLFGDDDDDD